MTPSTLSPTQRTTRRALLSLGLLVPLIIGLAQSPSPSFGAQHPRVGQLLTPVWAQATAGVSAGQVA